MNDRFPNYEMTTSLEQHSLDRQEECATCGWEFTLGGGKHIVREWKQDAEYHCHVCFCTQSQGSTVSGSDISLHTNLILETIRNEGHITRGHTMPTMHKRNR